MSDEALTYQQIDEIQDILGVALATPGETWNDFEDMLGELCRDLRAANEKNDNLRNVNRSMASEIVALRRESALLRNLINSAIEGLDDYWVTLPENRVIVKRFKEEGKVIR